MEEVVVFGPGPDGRAIPKHLPERMREQLQLTGYDARMLVPYIEARRGTWGTRDGRR